MVHERGTERDMQQRARGGIEPTAGAKDTAFYTWDKCSTRRVTVYDDPMTFFVSSNNLS